MDDCDIPDEMYPTAESLHGHMLENHSVMRWTCAYCSYDSNEIKHYNIQEWESHTAAEYEDITPTDQGAIFVGVRETSMIGPLFVLCANLPLRHWTQQSTSTYCNIYTNLPSGLSPMIRGR